MPVRRAWMRDLEDPFSLLSVRLKKSVQATCKHPAEERHITRKSATDTNELYELHYCEACDQEWTIWPEEDGS